jgi:ribosomal protein S27AE
MYNTSMDRYDERFCGKCGSSSESLKYQIPPHSVRTNAKFCPDCGAIMPNAPRKSMNERAHDDVPDYLFGGGKA